MSPGDTQAESAAPHAAARALGYSDMRARILHITFRDGTCTAAALMSELSLSRGGVAVHLKPLVAAGLLIPEQDPEAAGRGVGGSNRLRWHADAEAFEAALNAYRRSVRGEN